MFHLMRSDTLFWFYFRKDKWKVRKVGERWWSKHLDQDSCGAPSLTIAPKILCLSTHSAEMYWVPCVFFWNRKSFLAEKPLINHCLGNRKHFSPLALYWGFVSRIMLFLFEIRGVALLFELRRSHLEAKPSVETSMSKSCHRCEPILFFNLN